MKDFTSITVVLDRSGSMESCRDETINGFNVFLREQKAAGSNADITLVQFDSGGISTVIDAAAVSSAPELTRGTFVPRAATPLLDAVGTTIARTGDRLAAIAEAERPDKVVFVIITDGEENASREYKKETIRKMIAEQQDAYKWQFVFLGANQDAFAEASAMGFTVANTSNYATTDSVSAFHSAASNISSYRSNAQAASLAFSDEQRKQMKTDN